MRIDKFYKSTQKQEYLQKSRIYLQRFFMVLIILMFIIGMLGWVDGWGNTIIQEVVEVKQEEADVFSDPSLVNGVVTVLIHKWFDYENGRELWQDIQLHPTVMNYRVDTKYNSKVIATSVNQINKVNKNTAVVTAIVLREVTETKDNEIQKTRKAETMRIPLVYRDGALQPLSGPILEEGNRTFGFAVDHKPIMLTDHENDQLTRLAEGFLSALSSGSRNQIGFFFKNQSKAPNPFKGSIEFVRMIPISKNGDEIEVIVLARQIEEAGLQFNHQYKLLTEKAEDRYLIKQFEVGM